MQLSRDFQIAGDVRINQLTRIAKRIVGARFLTMEDFLPVVSSEQGQHLVKLSKRASGRIKVPILVLGVMPRSGTNFVRDLLALHPDVAPDPDQLYEFPLIHAAENAVAFTRDFLRYFPKNKEVLDEYDMLAMLSGAWFRELSAKSAGKHILLKCPHVQGLSLARYIFPNTKIILCLRDGRDVIDSTLNTFSRRSITRKTFRQLTHEWRLGTEAIMTFSKGGSNENCDTIIVRYEDIFADPHVYTKKMLSHIGLKKDSFPWAEIDRLPVRGSSRSNAIEEKRWQPEVKSKDFSPVKRWALWSERKRARFDKLAGSALELAGYER